MKGQGLPLTTIVIAAIAILVLVLLVAFATGALGKLFRGVSTIGGEITPTELSGFRLGCEKSCFEAQQLSQNPDEWEASDYCNRRLKGLKCWDANVTVDCSKAFTLATGTVECKGSPGGVCSC